MLIFKKISNKFLYKFYLYEKNINKKNINVYKYYFYNRNDLVLKKFVNKFIVIYNGKYWIYIKINKWFIGKKIGVFSWNRKKVNFFKK